MEQPRFWWINQGPTATLGHPYDTLWAPLHNGQGHRVPHWDALERLAVDDFALHYANGFVRGLGRVRSGAAPVTRPREWQWEAPGNDPGRQVTLAFQPFDRIVALADIPAELRRVIWMHTHIPCSN